MTTPPALSKKPAKTTDLKAVALFDFIAKEEDELGFKKNDIINVLVKNDESEWWRGLKI